MLYGLWLMAYGLCLCRSCRRLRSFDFEDQKIAAFGSSYRGAYLARWQRFSAQSRGGAFQACEPRRIRPGGDGAARFAARPTTWRWPRPANRLSTLRWSWSGSSVPPLCPASGTHFFNSLCFSDSLDNGVFQTIDQRSVMTNQFALCKRSVCGLRLYRRPAPPYDRRRCRNTMTGV